LISIKSQLHFGNIDDRVGGNKFSELNFCFIYHDIMYAYIEVTRHNK